MQLYGRSTISEFLGNNIAYRSLNPLDTRLPSLDELRASVRIPNQGVPRKTSADYASLISHLLKRARALKAPRTKITQLIFVGDTRLNDATAFNNICAAGDWPGLAFICDENPKEEAHAEILKKEENRIIYIANRWDLLNNFDQLLDRHDFDINERTAIILDLDKTCIGARGRNDKVINQARVDAAFKTVRSLIGDDFDAEAFEDSYNQFQMSNFHGFTTDNQDYLVYMCLIVSTGLYTKDQLADEILSRRIFRFDSFLIDVEQHTHKLPSGVREIHQDFLSRVRQGDPTPFKAFREQEFLSTVARMANLDDDVPMETRLNQEIVLTQEVRNLALDWNRRGALLFGLSDKPDEASVPTAVQASQGYLPLHQVVTHVVGE
jgi:hypothetical protein